MVCLLGGSSIWESQMEIWRFFNIHWVGDFAFGLWICNRGFWWQTTGMEGQQKWTGVLFFFLPAGWAVWVRGWAPYFRMRWQPRPPWLIAASFIIDGLPKSGLGSRLSLHIDAVHQCNDGISHYGSMGMVFLPPVYHTIHLNVGKCTIHGWYGLDYFWFFGW